MYSRMEKFHGRKAQRFSIRKYSFGAASVLLGTALFLGANEYELMRLRLQ